MKRIISIALAAAVLAACLSGCGGAASSGVSSGTVQALDLNALTADTAIPAPDVSGAVQIDLSDDGITVDGAPVTGDETAAVYTANDIIYYETGHDFTYGEGTAADEHTADEAAAHTVVHIAQPGVYRLSGSLSAGQIAVDLGKDAADDPSAVVTLVLDGADITCTVAPAVIFYNVYECGSDDAGTASKDVDTSAAGANVVIADGSVNNINGSYVARIYKSVELNEAGTEVVDSKKLHKYDAAFYSKMSMNLFGGSENTGVLNITAENEGLDSELHLTINGGVINIASGNDGINTNEDEVSVTTIQGGAVKITVTGQTGEGDGIDSNGWLVINGGLVSTSACASSADAGIDSDMGIWLNGGVVSAGGHMLDQIAGGTATYAVFQFAATQPGGQVYALKNAAGDTVVSAAPQNAFSVLILSAPDMAAGEYTLWCDDTQLAGGSGMMGGFGGGMRPGGMERPEGMTPPDGQNGELPELPDGQPPEGMQRPQGEQGVPQMPENGFDGQRPEGDYGGRGPEGKDPDGTAMNGGERSTVFALRKGGNLFSGVEEAEE